MSTVRIQLPDVFDYQRAAFFGPERYAVVEGSTKAGKTYPCMIWLLSEVGRIGKPGRNFWWVAPTHEQAEMVYGRMKRMLSLADPEGHTWKGNDTKKRIEINSLGTLVFKTGEDPDNLYGEDVFAVVMDEYTRQREESWHAVRSTLTATGGRCRFVGNVKGRKNWGYRLARQASKPDSGMKYAKFTAEDALRAGIIPQSEIDDARKMMPDHVFRELYYAEASEEGSNPFGFVHIRNQIRPVSSLNPVCFGVDLARKVDYTVVVGLDENGHVCRFDRWHGLSWESTTGRILAMIGQVPTLVDSTGLGDVVLERLRAKANVEGYQFTAKSKQQLIEGLGVDIQTGKIAYPDGDIVKELESFEFVPTRTGVTYSAPDGEHDDCVCALALAAKGHSDGGKIPEFYVGMVSGRQRAGF